PATAGSAPVPVAPVASAATSAASGNVLQLAASAPSWVQVTASNGKVIFSQLMQPGAPQSIQVPAGSTPLAIVVGNAPHTAVSYAGKPVDLTPDTRANVARFTLK
ncbi:MAG: helix-turn-helix domain-containing protein, partial [Thiomonas sp. 14-64-326]